MNKIKVKMGVRKICSWWDVNQKERVRAQGQRRSLARVGLGLLETCWPPPPGLTSGRVSRQAIQPHSIEVCAQPVMLGQAGD